MAFVCKLTDGTDEIDLYYSLGAGFSLLDEGFKPSRPEPRTLYGGIAETQLTRHYDGIRQVPLEMYLEGVSDDDLINRVNALERLVKKARDFHLLDYGNKVFLEFKLGDATETTRFPVLSGDMDIDRLMSLFCRDVQTIDRVPLVLTCKPYWEGADTHKLENLLDNPGFEETTAEDYIENGGFELWNSGVLDAQPDGWDDFESLAAGIGTNNRESNVKEGNYALRIEVDGINSGDYKGVVQNIFDLITPGEACLLSVWVENDAIVNGKVQIYANGDVSGTTLILDSGAANDPYTRHVGIFKTNASDTLLNIYIHITATANACAGTVSVDAIEVYPNAAPDGWTDYQIGSTGKRANTPEIWDVFQGQKAHRVDVSGIGLNEAKGIWLNILSRLDIGRTYILVGRVKNAAIANGKVQLIAMGDSSGNQFAFNSGNANAEYTEYMVTFTPSSSDTYLRIMCRILATADNCVGTAFFDRLLVMPGTAAPKGWMSSSFINNDPADVNYIDVEGIQGDIPALLRLNMLNLFEDVYATEGVWIGKRDREKVEICPVLQAEDSAADWILQAELGEVGGILCFAIFGSYLYLGTESADSKIYRTDDGKTYTLIASLGDGNVNCLCVHDGYLYAGTQIKIWRTDDGEAWSEDFEHPNLESFLGMASHADTGKIYSCSTGGKIFRRDAGGWVQEFASGRSICFAMLSDSGDLYVTTGSDGHILRGYGGTEPLTWTLDYNPADAAITLGIAKVGSDIYAGSREKPLGQSGGAGRVYKKSGGAWSLDHTFDEEQIMSVLADDGDVLVGAGAIGADLDGNIYRKASGVWSLEFESGQERVYSLAGWGSDLYAGAYNLACVYAYLAGGVGTVSSCGTCSGGKHKVYSSLSATEWTKLAKWEIDPDDVEEWRGVFRIIGRAESTWRVNIQWRVKITEGATFVYSVGEPVQQEEAKRYIDLGAFVLPPWAQVVGNPRSFFVELEYRVVSGGPWNIWIDYLALLPTDGFRIIGWGSGRHAYNTYAVDDGLADELFITPDDVNSDKRFVGTGLATRITLLPKQAQRLFFLQYSRIGWMEIDRSFKVTLEYRPRGIHLQGTE